MTMIRLRALWLAVSCVLPLSACALEEDVGDPSTVASGENLAGCDAASIRAHTPASRRAIIERGLRWIDLGVQYSKTRYFEHYRQDCSGFVSMCWQLGTSYSSHAMAPYAPGVAYELAGLDELVPGDAFNRADVDSNHGHVAIFAGWADNAHTRACVMEESAPGHPALISAWSGAYLHTYVPIRFTHDPPGVTEDPGGSTTPATSGSTTPSGSASTPSGGDTPGASSTPSDPGTPSGPMSGGSSTPPPSGSGSPPATSTPGAATLDLVAVKMNGTGTDSTEVHVLDAHAGYQAWSLETGTALAQTDADHWAFASGDYDRDGVADLYAIALSGTGSGRTEVHVLSGASGFQTFILHAATALPETAASQYVFALGDADHDGRADLVAVKLNGTGTHSVEVHVLSAASDFGAYVLETGTPLAETSLDQFAFLAADADRDGVVDLVAVKMNGTGTAHTELHVLSGASGYQSYLVQTGTALEESDRALWSFAAGDADGDGAMDLVALRRVASGTGSTEVHVLSAASGYQAFSLHSATVLPSTASSQWSLLAR